MISKEDTKLIIDYLMVLYAIAYQTDSNSATNIQLLIRKLVASL